MQLVCYLDLGLDERRRTLAGKYKLNKAGAQRLALEVKYEIRKMICLSFLALGENWFGGYATNLLPLAKHQCKQPFALMFSITKGGGAPRSNAPSTTASNPPEPCPICTENGCDENEWMGKKQEDLGQGSIQVGEHNTTKVISVHKARTRRW